MLAICFTLPLSAAELHRSVQYESGESQPQRGGNTGTEVRAGARVVSHFVRVAAWVWQIRCQLSCVVCTLAVQTADTR